MEYPLLIKISLCVQFTQWHDWNGYLPYFYESISHTYVLLPLHLETIAPNRRAEYSELARRRTRDH